MPNGFRVRRHVLAPEYNNQNKKSSYLSPGRVASARRTNLCSNCYRINFRITDWSKMEPDPYSADEEWFVRKEIVRRIIRGTFDWQPKAEAYETVNRIPVLPFVSSVSLPSESRPFDNLRDATPGTLANFLVEDSKLLRFLDGPGKYVDAFSRCWGVTSPDFSVMSQQEPFLRVLSTWLNRNVGLVWSQCGITVIPHVRWANSMDYDHCFAGITPGSVVSISNYGLWRNHELREGFVLGLPHLVERIQPSVVVLFGSDNKLVRRALGASTEVLPMKTNPHFAKLAS